VGLQGQLGADTRLASGGEEVREIGEDLGMQWLGFLFSFFIFEILNNLGAGVVLGVVLVNFPSM
jgi:hypothetical protein